MPDETMNVRLNICVTDITDIHVQKSLCVRGVTQSASLNTIHRYTKISNKIRVATGLT